MPNDLSDKQYNVADAFFISLLALSFGLKFLRTFGDKVLLSDANHHVINIVNQAIYHTCFTVCKLAVT